LVEDWVDVDAVFKGAAWIPLSQQLLSAVIDERLLVFLPIFNFSIGDMCKFWMKLVSVV
jgi:hypothetical protein